MVLTTPRLVLVAAIYQCWLIVVLGAAATERQEYVTSQCLVEEWEPWSSCIGNCNGAWQVRNRRVRQPSVPDRNGNPPPPCPHLYEVNRCSFPECEATNTFRLPEDSILVTPSPPNFLRMTTQPPSQSPPEPPEYYDEMSFEGPREFDVGKESELLPAPPVPTTPTIFHQPPKNITPAALEFVTPQPTETTTRNGQVLPPSARVPDVLSPVRPPAFPPNREKKPTLVLLQRIAHAPPRFEPNSAERSINGNESRSQPNDEDFNKPSLIRGRFGNDSSTNFRGRIKAPEPVTIIFNATEAPLPENKVPNSAEGSGDDEYEFDLEDGIAREETSSVCETSSWTDWTSCTGNCKMAWQVRNRDVVKPSIPIRGELLVPCPHLYEVRVCHLRGCKMPKIPIPTSDLLILKEPEEPSLEPRPIQIAAISSPPLVGSPPAEPTFEFRSTLTTAESTTPRPDFHTNPPAFETTFDSQIFETSIHLPSWWDSDLKSTQLLLPNTTAKWETVQFLDAKPTSQLQNPTTTPSPESSFQEIPATSEFITFNVPTADTSTIAEQFLTRNTRTTTTDEKSSAKTTRRIRGQTIIFGSDHTSPPPIADSTRTQRLDAPRNRSFHESFSLDQNNFTRFGIVQSVPVGGPDDRRKGNLAALVAKVEAADNTTEFVPAFPIFFNNNSNNNTNFTSLSVLNSRQFRPEFSNEEELFRVKRILEAHGLNLTDLVWIGDKLQCLKVPMVSECPDGKQPQPVLRWFRLPGHEECGMYNYPYCGHALEVRDSPLKFEEDCYQLCYTVEEKHKMEMFKRMRFEKGFRVDEQRN